MEVPPSTQTVAVVWCNLDSTEQLVEEVRHAVVVQLDTNDTTQVGIHQLHDYVAEVRGKGGRLENRDREHSIIRILKQTWKALALFLAPSTLSHV